MATTIFVQAANTHDHRIVLTEQDVAHPQPDGQLWIAGDERVWEVARTPGVQGALRDRTLVEVDAPTPKSQRRSDKNPLAEWPQLAHAGYKDVAAVSAASDTDLLRVVDQAALDEIRKIAPAKE